MKQKKIFTIPLLVITILLSACSNPTVVYEDKGNEWAAVYNYQEISDDSYNYDIQLIYQNDVEELKKLDEIIIEFKVGSSNFGGNLPIILLDLDEQVVFRTSGVNEGANLFNENTKIEVSIQWGNNEETLKLTK